MAQSKQRFCPESAPAVRRFNASTLRRRAAFSLIELLVVMAIIGILIILIVPAFTSIKSGSDVTSAANTVKSVLDSACTYAKANNTYTWVGFREENVANPVSPNSDTPAIGRLVTSIVASKDGTNLAASGGTLDPTKLIQVGKLTKIDNVHVAAFTDGSGTGSTFATRPPVTFNGTQYSIANMANSTPPLQYPVGSPAPTAQCTFANAIQFGPNGVAQIDNNNSFSVQTVAEIGIEPTHGKATPSSTPANVFAIQFGGVGDGVIIYRQ